MKKRLNNKGFTLVELLAVVVILAIVMGIAATSVLNSINNSRRSTLYSAAQNAANNLNTWVTEDAVVTDANDKKLGDGFLNATQGTNVDTWICLGNAAIEEINNGGEAANLLNALGLSENDIVINKEVSFSEETSSADPNCSALRYNSSSGGYEFLLVAKSGGKYYVTGDTKHFAYSRATGSNVAIND